MTLSPCGGTKGVSLPASGPPVSEKCCDAHHSPKEIAVERNRFFTGKYMTARDFHQEQWYFLNRGWLHQRTLHGWGIVCGLEVEGHPSEECAKDGWVVVHPGLAIDSFGRTLIVPHKTPVHLRSLTKGPEDSAKPADQTPFLLGLRYRERCIEKVPVLYDEQHCGQRTAYNRIEETAEFYLQDQDDTGQCWQVKRPSRNPCAPDRLSQGCLQPSNPCGDIVPIALVGPRKTWADVEKHLDFDGVRYVPGPLAPTTLTHICGCNWIHGKAETFKSLESSDPTSVKSVAGSTPPHEAGPTKPTTSKVKPSQTGQQDRLLLSVQFDRPLKIANGQPVGLDKNSFAVEYLSDSGLRIRIPGKVSVEPVHVPNCRRGQMRAVFAIDLRDCQIARGLLKALECRDVQVFVALHCDFILDYRGRAVDGNFLAGAFPTGDGVEGGTFESWFTLPHKSYCGGGGR